jgi:histidinol phosphatase-like enzyme
LSFGDGNLAARELYHSLYTLNRLDLRPKIREGILELYRNPVNKVAAANQSQLGQQTFPLSENARRLTEIVRELLREMATLVSNFWYRIPSRWRYG